MKSKHVISKLTVFVLLMMAIQVTYAAFSFTGLTDDHNKSSKYSLKNLNNLSRKGITYSAMKSNLQFKGSQFLYNKDTQNNTELNYMLSFENGNSTFIYPYKFKVRVATKFKTPTPPHH